VDAAPQRRGGSAAGGAGGAVRHRVYRHRTSPRRSRRGGTRPG